MEAFRLEQAKAVSSSFMADYEAKHPKLIESCYIDGKPKGKRVRPQTVKYKKRLNNHYYREKNGLNIETSEINQRKSQEHKISLKCKLKFY